MVGHDFVWGMVEPNVVFFTFVPNDEDQRAILGGEAFEVGLQATERPSDGRFGSRLSLKLKIGIYSYSTIHHK